MSQFLIALKFGFKEQLINKFAFGLLIIFVPIWYLVLGVISASSPVVFKFSTTDSLIHVNGHDLVLISAGLNLLTMMLGFMFFHSMQRSMEFDRRLIKAGLNRMYLILANTIVLLSITAVAALYMVLVLMLFWHFPYNIFEVWLGFWLVSLTYGSLGRIIGLLVSNELPGFFFIVMFSMTDVFLQNPLGNPAANKPFLRFFPSYSAMQLSVAGGFTHIFAVAQVIVALVWYFSFLTTALSLFYFKTRKNNSIKNVNKPDFYQDHMLQPEGAK